MPRQLGAPPVGESLDLAPRHMTPYDNQIWKLGVSGKFNCPTISPIEWDYRLGLRIDSGFGALKPGLGHIVGWLTGKFMR